MRAARLGVVLPGLLLWVTGVAAAQRPAAVFSSGTRGPTPARISRFARRPSAVVERFAVSAANSVVWRLDGLSRAGGHPIALAGAPRVTATEIGSALEFDGVDDGLFVDVNPLSGLTRFTIEIVFKPAADGPQEQRFFHVEEPETGNRALLELRMLPGGRWTLDTYLRSGANALTLLDRARAHSADRWHSVALVYDGTTMAHYVNGVREMSGVIAFAPLQGGRTSIGVRQNRVSWFKGQIHTVRITPEALTSDRMLDAKAGAPDVIPLRPEGGAAAATLVDAAEGRTGAAIRLPKKAMITTPNVQLPTPRYGGWELAAGSLTQGRPER